MQQVTHETAAGEDGSCDSNDTKLDRNRVTCAKRQSMFADALSPTCAVDRKKRLMSAFITPMTLHTELVAPASTTHGARATIARRTMFAAGQDRALSHAAKVHRATLAARPKLAAGGSSSDGACALCFTTESPEKGHETQTSDDELSGTCSGRISAGASDDFPLPVRSSWQLLEQQSSTLDATLPAQCSIGASSISQLELSLGKSSR
jgi:hypothetical protein